MPKSKKKALKRLAKWYKEEDKNKGGCMPMTLEDVLDRINAFAPDTARQIADSIVAAAQAKLDSVLVRNPQIDEAEADLNTAKTLATKYQASPA